MSSKVIKIGKFEELISSSVDVYDPERAEFYADALYKRIESSISLETIKVISFDVFDTLLLRNEKYELYRFLEMSERVHSLLVAKGIESLSVWDIYAARLTSFRVCYRTVEPTCTVREGRLIDVLTLMAKILDLDAWIVPELVRIELTYEEENLRVNPFLKVFLSHPVIRSKEIIFISDMYLPGEWIYQLVKKSYQEFNFLKFYSSADYGLTKSSGLLYDAVIKDLKIQRDAVIHMGDNFRSDVQLAKERGLHGIHLPIPEVQLKAREVEREKFRPELVAQGFDLSLIY